MGYTWVTCPVCGHKLFKCVENSRAPAHTGLEIKCHSCKSILDIIFYDGKVRRIEHGN